MRSAATDCSEPNGSDKQDEQHTSATAGRPPPIVLTAFTNLMQLQKDIKSFVKGNFELEAHVTGLVLSLDRWAIILPLEHISMAEIHL
jgi:hypothetical protein